MSLLNKFFDSPPVEGLDDLLTLPEHSHASIYKNIKDRYEKNIYYTYLGESLISMNPNRPNLSIYGQDYMEYYQDKPLHEVPPHIFAISDVALRKAFDQPHNGGCCLVITGESGSGKTEASKLILLYIAHQIRSLKQSNNRQLDDITKTENNLLHSNCLLEAFGNATTKRNNNSSRFGKYIELTFGYKQNTLTNEMTSLEHHSGNVHNYLLEKSRVVKHCDGERNFHAFYQLLAALKAQSLPKGIELLSLEPSYYKYLKDNRIDAKDGQQFEQVMEAMKAMQFSPTLIKTIYRILAAILVLGNVEFDLALEPTDVVDGGSGTGSNSIDMASLHKCIESESRVFLAQFCQLLELDETQTISVLCSRKISVPREEVVKAYTPEEAYHGRNAMAMSLYERLFNLILTNINGKLNGIENRRPTVGEQCKVNKLGILDIYGFEVSPDGTANSFEQCLINFFNEKLHQLFVEVNLMREQKLYHNEQIEWQDVAYEDNLPICRLIGDPSDGLLALLDDVCFSGQVFTNEEVLKMFNQKFANCEYFRSRELCLGDKSLEFGRDFAIRHYAGEVIYSVEDFIEKNTDQLYHSYKKLLHSSGNPLLKGMYADGRVGSKSNKRKMTTAHRFCRSMDILMDRLRSSQQLYIRCIKPNDEDMRTKTNIPSTTLNEGKVYHQIRYLGILENVLISKAGYWHKTPYDQFLARYAMLLPKKEDIGPKKANRELAIEIVEQYRDDHEQQSKAAAFGKTMLFVRDAKLLSALEAGRMRMLESNAIKLQAHIRGHLARHRLGRLRLAIKLFLDFHQYKLHQVLGVVIAQWTDYVHRLKVAVTSTPADQLEYDQLPVFASPIKLVQQSPLALHDRHWISAHLLPVLDYLNRCLLVYTLPYEYWREQGYRSRAAKCFGDGCKQEWGQTRRRWTGNYLVDAGECPYYRQIKTLLRRHPQSFGFEWCRVRFSAFIVTTNRYDCLQIYGLVLIDSGAIFKVKLAPNMSVSAWAHVKDIIDVSVTHGADQLVVLHSIRAGTGDLAIGNDDLVFAFCSLKGDSNNEDLQSWAAHDQGNKVGEFVTLVAEIYSEIYPNTKLPVMIGMPIKFRVQGKVHEIIVVDEEQQLLNTNEVFGGNASTRANNTNINMAQRVKLELREGLRKLNTGTMELLHSLASTKTFYGCYTRIVCGSAEQDKSNVSSLAQLVRIKKHGTTRLVMLYK